MDQAVEIVSLKPGGPADVAGLRRGDIVVTVNGQPVASVDGIFRILAEWPVGKAIAVSYLRGKNLEHRDITPTESV
jgi:serine protease Do